MTHSIYVIGSDSEPYKLGYSNNPAARLAVFQTSYPAPLRVWMTAPTSQPRIDEAALHAALDDYRMAGEWFGCDLGAIREAMAAVGLVPTDTAAHQRSVEDGELSGEAFARWLREMRKRPFFASDAACGRLLGVSANTVLEMKQRGADTRTALACRALLHRLEPYA